MSRPSRWTAHQVAPPERTAGGNQVVRADLARNPRSTRLLLWCGALVPTVLAGTLLLGSLLTPGYSQVADTLSDLAEQNRPHAIVMRLGMIVCGTLIVAFVTGLRRVMPAQCRRDATALYAAGIFAILAGVFQDFGPDPGGPRNAEGYIHTIAAICLIGSILGSMGLAARGTAKLPGDTLWASLARPSMLLLTLAAICSLFFLFGPTRLEGLAQRGIFLASLAWLLAVTVTALRIEAAAHPEHGTPAAFGASSKRLTLPLEHDV